MDIIIGHVNSFKFAHKIIFLLSAVIFFVTTAQSSFAQERTNCGRPNFDRSSERGVFLWQNCATGDWFIRTTNGGLNGELRTEGRLSLSNNIESIEGFNLDAGDSGQQDLLDFSNPRNIIFRFRIFSAAQDGANFQIASNSRACLFIRNSANLPVIVGRNNLELRSPFNIQTLNGAGCAVISPIISLLLDDESN